MIREILAKSQFFSQLDEQSMEEVAAAATVMSVGRQAMVFFEGDQAHAIYIVGSGKVKVFKQSPDGKEQILMIAGVGESFAEAALFSGGRYPASAQALEECELVVMNRERFVGLMGKHPELAVNLIARLSSLLRKMTALVEELSLTDVSTRLAHYLVMKIHEEGFAADHRVTLTVKKGVLASQLGTIPETLSRSLARLTREKVIAVDGPHIEILDLTRLKELAGESD